MAKTENLIFKVIALGGFVVGTVAIAQALNTMRKRKQDEAEIEEIVVKAENFSGAIGHPCGAKRGQPCKENQGGDWIQGTWQSAGYGRGCECRRGRSSSSARRPISMTRAATPTSRRARRSVRDIYSSGGTSKIITAGASPIGYLGDDNYDKHKDNRDKCTLSGGSYTPLQGVPARGRCSGMNN